MVSDRRRIALLAVMIALTGCDNLFDLDEVELPPPDEDEDNAYVCTCTCVYDDTGAATRRFEVCLPAALNPNVTPDAGVPSPSQLANDCVTRVQDQLAEMTDECTSPDPECTCTTASPVAETLYSPACDKECAPVPLDDGCTNWDFRTGVKTANCADDDFCTEPGPVCLTPTSDPPTPVPAAFAAGFHGQSTLCLLTSASDITVTAEGQTRVSPLVGYVELAPAPETSCAPGEACWTLNYGVKTTQSLTFDGLLGLVTVSLRDLATVGASLPFGLDGTGAGVLPAESTQSAGRGTQVESDPLGDSTSRVAAYGTNTQAVTVTYDGVTATIDGALLGAVGEPDADNLIVVSSVVCAVENTPPVADFGGARTVECTSPTGAAVVLDASSSTDAEENLASFAWTEGSRAGTSLGTGPSITVQQALGTRTYFLKAIDAFMQMSEASAAITVADTTAPTVSCNAASTIVPSSTPYVFTATATDACDGGLSAPSVLDYTCLSTNGSGRLATRDQCAVQFSGATFTILDSGGVGDVIRWRVRAADASGNSSTVTCETRVVRKK